ncbi:MAG: hypothetical protein KDJ97_27655 [Anaerolineae bacterium]|nr:hypothetical protein [Anaerolineae bacterium]
MRHLTINDPLAGVLKDFPGSIFHLPPAMPAVIPTGFPTLDQALGIGGLPRGRIIDIRGPESSGKSSLVLSTIAQAQAAGGHGCVIDLDGSLDPVWCRRWGVDADRLFYAPPAAQRRLWRLRTQWFAPAVMWWPLIARPQWPRVKKSTNRSTKSRWATTTPATARL